MHLTISRRCIERHKCSPYFLFLSHGRSVTSLVIQFVRYRKAKNRNANSRRKGAAIPREPDFSIEGLKPVVLTQIYWFAAVYCYHSLALTLLVLFNIFFSGIAGFLLFGCTQCYFMYSETCVIQEQTKSKFLSSFCLMIVALTLGFAVMVLCMCVMVFLIILVHAKLL